jgi:hypothetical protein
LVSVLDVDRKKDVSILDLGLVLLGLDLRNPHPDQRPGESADRGSGRRSTERRHDRTRSNEWAQSGNRECANPCQQTDRAADGAACARTRDSTLGCLGVLLMREVSRTLLVGEQSRNVVAGEAPSLKLGDDDLRLNLRRRDTDD